jgi:hypothetical protein
MISDSDFLNLDLDSQNEFLIKLATNSLHIIEKYPDVHAICKDSMDRAEEFQKNSDTAAEYVGLYLNHPNPDLDLSVQICFVNDNEEAVTVIGIVAFATGAISRKAYMDQNIKGIPEPILMAEPTEIVSALDLYRFLLDKGLVPDI